MMKYLFDGILKEMIQSAKRGKSKDVDLIFSYLNKHSTLAETRFADYSLGLVKTSEGIDRIRHYLHHGSQIQRNYASLFFNRRGDWVEVKHAFDLGLIDEIQAFAR